MSSRFVIAVSAAVVAFASTASDARIHLFGSAKKVQASRGPRPIPYRWTQGAAPKAYTDMVATFGTHGLAPGHFVIAKSIPAVGDTQVVVDLVTQMAYVYRGEHIIGASTISTGRQGRITPLGVWSVLEKRKFYRSKKYDNAAMPFMQRIDQYGIALHGGGTPGYPESHGCIHLPMKFAEKLYGLTKVGSKVVIEG
jgi:lipoprotein-anchoring transpeptidase ErfK/SrfK